MITVLFFGPVADRVGANRLEVGFQAGMRVLDLQMQLQPRYPEAFELVSIAAVNGSLIRDRAVELADQSEVVFMSRFSGG
jgi:molybdopterin synthase sulfur carrier subunit